MFGGGGGGLDPRKMQKMMEQMGIDMDEFDAERVEISLTDGDQLIFDEAEVTKMEARGQSTYMVVGEPDRQEGTANSGTNSTDSEESELTIPQSDIDIVVERTGSNDEEARQALVAEEGDLAAAISRLS